MANGEGSSVTQAYHTIQQREGGGFVIRRSIGSASLSSHDPFLMLDHLGPVVYGPGEAVGAPDHPHRGFETVTYVLKGGFHHLDSNGNEGNLRDGWVQWMTAGSGVIHSEMPTKELLENGGPMEGFQLWVNLPSSKKMIPPRYQDTPPEKIPKTKTPDGLVNISVIAGEALGVSANIETHTPIMFLDVRLSKGGVFTQPIPKDFNSFFYVYSGKGIFGTNSIEASEGSFVVLKHDGDEFTMKAGEDSECKGLLIGGLPINEPIARYGPFVMNTQQEIRQAFQDYQTGKFGKEIEGSAERMKLTQQAVHKQKNEGKWKDDL